MTPRRQVGEKINNFGLKRKMALTERSGAILSVKLRRISAAFFNGSKPRFKKIDFFLKKAPLNPAPCMMKLRLQAKAYL